jgi:hypothetical protein
MEQQERKQATLNVEDSVAGLNFQWSKTASDHPVKFKILVCISFVFCESVL